MLVGHLEKNFDIDLRFGNDGEGVVLSLLNGGQKIEVKTDRLAHLTGNIAVEFRYKGYPSGISTTEADYWAFVFFNHLRIIFIEINELKAIARECYKEGKIKNGGDNNMSEMVLIPLTKLIK